MREIVNVLEITQLLKLLSRFQDVYMLQKMSNVQGGIHKMKRDERLQKFAEKCWKIVVGEYEKLSLM